MKTFLIMGVNGMAGHIIAQHCFVVRVVRLIMLLSTETITIRRLAETCAEMNSSAVHIQLPIPEESMEKSPILQMVCVI